MARRRRSSHGRRSDIGKLHHATLHRSQRPLEDLSSELGWASSKIERVVQGSHGHFRFVRGGPRRTVANYGTEQGRRGEVAVYNAVLRQLRGTWAKTLVKTSLALDTSRGSSAGGALLRPDAVMLAYPKRGHTSATRPHLHAFEIEAFGRFSIHSLYQAHSQGRFADASWVVFVRDARASADLPIAHGAEGDGAEGQWEHLDWVARRLGVGLISCSNPAVSSTWTVHRRAAMSSCPSPERIAALLPADLRDGWRMTYREFADRRDRLMTEHGPLIGRQA
ncbi:MAG: hypothetical protein AAGG08_08165 [Actinomycetota bacterium]